ncbi:hypothetical protein vcoNHCC006C_000194B, partial [Vibrio cholerae O1 str. NHCC-006C]|jgi:cAMP-dependent protein kinase regulator
LKD